MTVYRENLALVHDLGFGFHAERTAPGILALLEPVRAGGGVVHEIGCGTGLLTRYLLDAGHTVIASDASQAMLDRARAVLGADVDLRRIALPDDPLPTSDAVVSVGHALSYLPDERSVHRALTAIARALRPGGVLAIDLLDLAWGDARRNAEPQATVTADYAIFSRYSLPAPDTYVRDMTTFVPAGDGRWRRDDEQHENVLVDTSAVPGVLAIRFCRWSADADLGGVGLRGARGRHRRGLKNASFSSAKNASSSHAGGGRSWECGGVAEPERGDVNLDLDAFLARPLIAHLATASPEGPRESPLWFLWEDAAVWFVGNSRDSFPRRIARDGRCAVGFVEFDLVRGVLLHVGMRGDATVVPLDRDRMHRLLRRYLGEDSDGWNPEFRRSVIDGLDLMVRFVPASVVVRDQSYFAAGSDGPATIPPVLSTGMPQKDNPSSD